MEPLSTVPRVVKFTSGLSAVVAEEGSEATFQCVVTPSDVAVTWFRDGVQLQSSEKFLMSQKGASHSLTILSLALEDAGQPGTRPGHQENQRGVPPPPTHEGGPATRDAFELWCWRRLLRVPWTARRSNQSILKEISPEYSLEGLMLKLKLQYFAHLMQELTHLKRP